MFDRAAGRGGGRTAGAAGRTTPTSGCLERRQIRQPPVPGALPVRRGRAGPLRPGEGCPGGHEHPVGGLEAWRPGPAQGSRCDARDTTLLASLPEHSDRVEGHGRYDAGPGAARRGRGRRSGRVGGVLLGRPGRGRVRWNVWPGWRARRGRRRPRPTRSGGSCGDPAAGAGAGRRGGRGRSQPGDRRDPGRRAAACGWTRSGSCWQTPSSGWATPSGRWPPRRWRRTTRASWRWPRRSCSGARQESDAALEARQQAIEGLVTPVRESLDKVDGKIQELERERGRGLRPADASR